MRERNKRLQRRDFVSLSALGIVGGVSVPRRAIAASDSPEYIPIKGSAWRLVMADLDGDGANELVYGAYEGALRAIRPSTGKLLWEAPLAGFPFAITARDINGDGKDEIFVAVADGSLVAFSPNGGLLWTFRSDRPMYNVSVGSAGPGKGFFIACGGMDRTVTVLSPAGKPLATHPVTMVVNRLATGDFDGDSSDEILVVDDEYSSVSAELLQFRGGRLDRVWRKPLKAPHVVQGGESWLGYFHALALDIGDLNLDGRPEIVAGDSYYNAQSVMALSAEVEPLWISDPVRSGISQKTWGEFYSTAFVKIADVLLEMPGRKVVTVAGGLLRIFDRGGKLLVEADAPIGFTDLAIDGQTLYLGSSPNGDNTIYRIRLDADIGKAWSRFERQGLARGIGDNLARLRQQVMRYKRPEDAPRGPYQFSLSQGGALPRLAVQLRELSARFSNVRFITGRVVRESSQPIRFAMTADQIVELAQSIERLELSTVFYIGHSHKPFITLKTAERMLQAAPRYLVGFVSAEDEKFAEFPQYLKEYIGPLADLCVKYGHKQCQLFEKGLWWTSMPAFKEVYEGMLTGERGKVIVAMTEDSNSRTPELNLLGRVGLRQAGLTEFGVGIIADLFSFNRFHQWEYPKHGHPYLRLLVAHTLLGGSRFAARGSHIYVEGDALEFTDMGRESVELFAHMLDKGLVFPPKPEQIVGLSRVGIVMHQPPEKWLIDGHNGHYPNLWQEDQELRNAAIPLNGCEWGNSPTPVHALQHVLLRKTRQFGYHFPPTPYGPFVIVPAHANLKAVTGVDQWWHTDGISVWREGGRPLTGAAAAEALQQSFEKAAARLPFRTSGDDVFFVSARTGPDRYRLYAIDPGYLDPRERSVTLRVQLPGNYTITDLLTGKPLSLKGGTTRFSVPAGSLRILEAARVGR